MTIFGDNVILTHTMKNHLLLMFEESSSSHVVRIVKIMFDCIPLRSASDAHSPGAADSMLLTAL